jgi:hypothetical protein
MTMDLFQSIQKLLLFNAVESKEEKKKRKRSNTGAH